ncbi:MAG: cupredoxin domain-containing protein [Patescibacteria group bacterium]
MKLFFATLIAVALVGGGCLPSAKKPMNTLPEAATATQGMPSGEDAATKPVVKPAAKPTTDTKLQLQPSAGTTQVKPGPQTYTVTITDTGFSPATMAVNVGDKVMWINKSTKPQTSASAGNTLWDSGNIAVGKSYTRTFTAVGSYNYVSGSTHLTGTVVVH